MSCTGVTCPPTSFPRRRESIPGSRDLYRCNPPPPPSFPRSGNPSPAAATCTGVNPPRLRHSREGRPLNNCHSEAPRGIWAGVPSYENHEHASLFWYLPRVNAKVSEGGNPSPAAATCTDVTRAGDRVRYAASCTSLEPDMTTLLIGSPFQTTTGSASRPPTPASTLSDSTPSSPDSTSAAPSSAERTTQAASGARC